MTTATTAIVKMTAAERAELKHQESIIKDGLRSMQNVGTALSTICEKKLWRGEYESFEDYCLKRWGFKSARAYQLITGAKFFDDLTNFVKEEKPEGLTDQMVDNTHLCEGHVRALMSNADGFEQQVELLAESLKAAGTHGLTEGVIKKTATALYGDKPVKPGKPAKTEPESVPATPPEPEDDDDSNDPPVSEFRDEPPSTFNPEELEGTAQPPAAGSEKAKRDAIQKQIASLQKRLESALEDTGPLIRALDDCHAGSMHKLVVGHYHRLAGDLGTALDALKELTKVWNDSGKKKTS